MVRSAAANDLQLSRIFWEHTIRLDLAPKDKWDAIAQMVDALIEEKQIPASERHTVLEAALDRERKGSTSLGHGTAIPHCAHPRSRRDHRLLGDLPAGASTLKALPPSRYTSFFCC